MLSLPVSLSLRLSLRLSLSFIIVVLIAINNAIVIELVTAVVIATVACCLAGVVHVLLWQGSWESAAAHSRPILVGQRCALAAHTVRKNGMYSTALESHARRGRPFSPPASQTSMTPQSRTDRGHPLLFSISLSSVNHLTKSTCLKIYGVPSPKTR